MQDDVNAALRETCILAIVRCRALGLNRTDKEASRKVDADAGAVSGASRVVVSRLPGADEHHKKIVKAQGLVKAALHKWTTRYGNDEGWRLLPNMNWQPMLLEFSKAKKEADAALADFLADLPNVVARAQRNKGTLNIDIPTEAELRDAYSMESEFRPIAEGRFPGMPPAAAEKLRAHFERKLREAAEMAVLDVAGRFAEPLTHFVERMNVYDQRVADIAAGKDVGKTGTFRDSVVENLQELAQVIDGLNPTKDARLDVLSSAVKALIIEPDTLRKDDAVRNEATERARRTLVDLQDWLSPAPSAMAA